MQTRDYQDKLIEFHPMDEFNQQLLDNVHPPAWENPDPTGRYNLVVIGAGAAGLVTAAVAAAIGASDGAGERPFGDHCVASTRRSAGPSERPSGENQHVVRTHGIGLRIHALPEILGAQTPFTDVIVGPLHVERFWSHLP